MWHKTLGSVQMLTVAATDLRDAIALVKQLHPGAVIDESLCTEYYDNGNVNELRNFPRYFCISGHRSKADSDAFSEFVDAGGYSGDINLLHYIVMRRVEG